MYTSRTVCGPTRQSGPPAPDVHPDVIQSAGAGNDVVQSASAGNDVIQSVGKAGNDVVQSAGNGVRPSAFLQAGGGTKSVAFETRTSPVQTEVTLVLQIFRFFYVFN